jgi:asparagine synthase (glutamine-hydrolysing)
LFEKLTYSVKNRLRSDVTVGTSLSGGLDSSTIVALIQQEQNSEADLNTFSSVFPGFAKDESKYIQLANRKFGIKNFTVTPSSENFIQDFDKLLYHQEEPFQSASIYAQYKVYELAKQHGVTVLLDGQGADETLGGYTKYYHWYWQQLLRGFKFGELKKEQAATKQNGNTVDWNFKNYAAAFLPRLAASKLQNQLKQSVYNHTVLSKDFVYAYFNEASFEKPIIKSLNDVLYYNTFKSGLEDLLRYADRNSMAHGREVRLPFLNHELVEFIFSLPAHFKIKNGFTKYILRVTMQNFLPNEIVWRKDKVGFEPPQQQWMQNKQIQEKLADGKQQLVSKGICKKEILEQKTNFKAAHDANNIDWWLLCSSSLIH